MRDVVIAGYLRTAQTRSRPNDPARDWFCKLRADELLAKILPEVIQQSGVEPEEVDDFLVGCATGVSEQWAYGGRNPIFLANLPDTIAAKFIDPFVIHATSSLNASSELRRRFCFFVHFAFLLLESVSVLCDEGFSCILRIRDKYLITRSLNAVVLPFPL